MQQSLEITKYPKSTAPDPEQGVQNNGLATMCPKNDMGVNR